MSAPSLSAIGDTVANAEALRGAYLHRYSPAELEQRAEVLVDTLSAHGGLKSIEVTPSEIWYRARLVGNSRKPFDTLHDCLCPPKERVDFGRANYPREPVFYGSWNSNTVLSEIAAAPGDYVQVVQVRAVKRKVAWATLIGEYERFMSSNHSLYYNKGAADRILSEIEQESREVILPKLFLDAFFAEQFRNPHQSRNDCRLTAAISKSFYKKKIGIIYPSVQKRDSMNIAIPADLFERDFEVMSCSFLQVKDCWGYSLFESAPLLVSKAFHSDGSIEWIEFPRGVEYRVGDHCPFGWPMHPPWHAVN